MSLWVTLAFHRLDTDDWNNILSFINSDLLGSRKYFNVILMNI